ncbi:MAG TPA: hypothetical protein VGN68_07890 [Sphingopyxis sp.]|jgi:hypothetical protein|uniref:hypothetical protein n=1 Tax=Sphingopyxis sp. TaxID=1908224 RepID=UPI002E12D2BE|nr:hypothetical protein [Sphingopyxis sp.]
MSSLIDLVRAELSTPVDPRVTAMAQAIAAEYPGSARAVLFYGSCLRMSELDGLMLDFYLIVSDYSDAYPKRWLAAANRLIPPNVFPFQHGGLIAKYAVLSEKDFAHLNSGEASNVSVWARFAQPSRLVWAVDHVAADRVFAAVAEAPVTLFSLTIPTMAPDVAAAPVDIWRAGFNHTYQAELRAERTGRSVSIVDADLDRYERFALATLAEIAARRGVGPDGEVPNAMHPDTARRRWGQLRRRGKALSIARLAKASLTYAGGIDYLAWKINRHAGTKIEIKPWQRRWPLVAALTLVPRLMKSGAIR